MEYSYHMELMSLVVMLANRYNHLESTSIPYEKAESLMKAVIYTIEHDCSQSCSEEMKKLPTVQNAGESLEKRYIQGKKNLYVLCQRAQEKYNKISLTFDDYGCVALRDTYLKAIPGFFQNYDMEFAPFLNIITMDYNLLTNRYLEKEGIDAICEYLTEIEMEQKFLSKMKKMYVIQTLNTISPGYEALFDNMTETMLLNLILRSMVKNGLIDFSSKRLISCSEMKLMELLHKELILLVQKHLNNDQDLFRYLSGYLPGLLVRIITANENNHIEKFLMI